MTAVDFAKKEVQIDGGKETFKYGTLVLAPGATPRRLPRDVDCARLSTKSRFILKLNNPEKFTKIKLLIEINSINHYPLS